MIFSSTFQAKPLCSPLLVVNAFLTLNSHLVIYHFQADGCLSAPAHAFLSFALSPWHVWDLSRGFSPRSTYSHIPADKS